MSPNDDDLLLTPAQLGEREDIPGSKSLYDQARCKGTGPAYLKVGNRIYYRLGTVRAWLKSKERTRVWEFDGRAA